MNKDYRRARQAEPVCFGQRSIPPRACVIENKSHVRNFLAEMLEELGFDLLQGPMLGQPVEPHRFARAILAGRQMASA